MLLCEASWSGTFGSGGLAYWVVGLAVRCGRGEPASGVTDYVTQDDPPIQDGLEMWDFPAGPGEVYYACHHFHTGHH